MTTTKAKYNRQKARRHRRRWTYPELKAGQVATLERDECGLNKSIPIPTGDTMKPFAIREFHGRFEFIREIPRGSRSKYMPKARAA